ncbi:hypothetical protein F7725_022975 [Dissostichus mawsoni]|uniref:Biopterin-dependent aromatic amino acid hydroxylase family profile domain-containing protein n=1 Tax=Dissostichus mawsoni TaxID=36200 RepID=A0A7J5YZL2_DISMA|nr:hypothetical protein F7725_022975 [Dissostichus mawsoni]
MSCWVTSRCWQSPASPSSLRRIGLASLGASDDSVQKLATCYFFTVEFGLCKQEGQLRAYGAGLLSSISELKHALSGKARIMPFDPKVTSKQECIITTFQDVYFVSDSFEEAKVKMREFAKTIKRPFTVRYNPYTQSVDVLKDTPSINSVVEELRHELDIVGDALSRLNKQLGGANSYGQLGQGHVDDQPEPRFSDITALQHKAVRTLTGGGDTPWLSPNGEVFVCGQNNRGQLGLGHIADITTLLICPSLTQRVSKVACGWEFTICLTDSGRVLACGSNAFGQLGVGKAVSHSADLLVVESEGSSSECSSRTQTFISCYSQSTHPNVLFNPQSQAVYISGELVFAVTLREHSAPGLSPPPQLYGALSGLDQKNVHMVTAGLAHCVCLTEDGDLFLWGSNKHGQLTSTEPFLSSPTLVKRSLLGGEKVVLVCSGWTHIVAQTESRRVYTWGRGGYGQLGRQTCHHAERQMTGPSAGSGNTVASLPAEVKVLCGATQIACGSEHNLAILGGVSSPGAGTNMGCVATVPRATSFSRSSSLVSDLFSLAAEPDTLWQ